MVSGLGLKVIHMPYEVQASGPGYVIAWGANAAGLPALCTKRQGNLAFLQSVAAGLNDPLRCDAYLFSLDFFCKYEYAV
jgi:hypothetical protein